MCGLRGRHCVLVQKVERKKSQKRRKLFFRDVKILTRCRFHEIFLFFFSLFDNFLSTKLVCDKISYTHCLYFYQHKKLVKLRGHYYHHSFLPVLIIFTANFDLTRFSLLLFLDVHLATTKGVTGFESLASSLKRSAAASTDSTVLRGVLQSKSLVNRNSGRSGWRGWRKMEEVLAHSRFSVYHSAL